MHLRLAMSRLMIVSCLLGFAGCASDSPKPAAETLTSSGSVKTEDQSTPGEIQERAVPIGKSSAAIRDQRMPIAPLPAQVTPSTGGAGPLPIVGGTHEPDYKYPWVVRMNGCSGVLIDPQWVLTAAHCVTPNIGFGKLTYIRMDPYTGSVQTETVGPYPEQRPNPGVYIHPNYTPSSDQANDIALIKLERPFASNPYIQTVGLPKDFRHAGIVGILSSIDHLRPLPPGQAAIFRAPIPQDTYPPKFNITASAAMASLCPGDSGSGFVTVENGRATVRGIASQGTITDCMTPSGEATFTDVFAFRGWILQTMGKNDNFSTRVRWSGYMARGTMALGCANPYNMTLVGPLNVAGVEEGMSCEAGQTQSVICNLEKNQGNVGVMVPVLSSLTMRTTLSNGTSSVQTIPASNNFASFFGLLPAGTSREFTCQIGTPITGTGAVIGTNTQIQSRGIEGQLGGEPTIIQPSPFDPSEETKP